MQAYFGRVKAACLSSYCCNRHLCYDGGRLGRVKIVTLRVGARAKEGKRGGGGEKKKHPTPLLLTLPSFRVSTCAFASKTFVRPKKTPALQAKLHYGIVLENAAKRLGQNPLQTVPQCNSPQPWPSLRLTRSHGNSATTFTCSLSSLTSLSFSALNFRTSTSLPTVGDNSRRAMLASFSDIVASNAFCLKCNSTQKVKNRYIWHKGTGSEMARGLMTF